MNRFLKSVKLVALTVIILGALVGAAIRHNPLILGIGVPAAMYLAESVWRSRRAGTGRDLP